MSPSAPSSAAKPRSIQSEPDADAASVTAAPVLLSVCVPAYNRAPQLDELLHSIVAQDYPNYEVVICEDNSPQREQIRAVAERYGALFPGRIRYHENAENLGYDANFRAMLRRSRGTFCFIMGNDDLVAPGAFATVADVVRRTPDVGVILRSFAYFREDPRELFTIARYSPDELRLPPGPDTVVQFYRRAVSMSGLVLHRDAAVALETERYDGLLFYQMHLIAQILMRRPGVIVPEVLAYYRVGGTPEFGSSKRERERFIPGQLEPRENVRFLEGILTIARGFDEEHGTNVYRRVRRDLGRHIYPTFAGYADRPLRQYVALYRGLWGLGLWRYPLFHAFGVLAGMLGKRRLDRVLFAIRRRLGYTPTLGERPAGAVVTRSPNLGDRPHA